MEHSYDIDELICEIEAHARKKGIAPATVVRQAGAGNGSVFAKWKARQASPRLNTAQTVMDHIRANSSEGAT